MKEAENTWGMKDDTKGFIIEPNFFIEKNTGGGNLGLYSFLSDRVKVEREGTRHGI